MSDISKHYGSLSPVERLQAAIDAMGRGDWDEAKTLSDACPKVQYVAQRDMAYTSKFQSLQTLSLLHALSFWQGFNALMATMRTGDARTYAMQHGELMAFIGAWKRFCAYVGFDSDAVLKAFGLQLDPARMNDLPPGDEPDETMIDDIYQGHLRHWA